jgi:hypothetical protein
MNKIKLLENECCILCDNLLYIKKNKLNNCELIENIDKENIYKYCFIHMLEHDLNFKKYIINNDLEKLYKNSNNAIINKNKKYQKFKIEYDKEFFKILKNITIPNDDNIVYDSNHINNIRKMEDEYQNYKKYNYDKYLKKTESDFVIHWRFWMLKKFSKNYEKYQKLIEEIENNGNEKDSNVILSSNNNNSNSNFGFMALMTISAISNMN